MKRLLIFAFVLYLSLAEAPAVFAQRYVTWTISTTLRYNKRCYEKQDVKSKLYGIIPGEVIIREFLVSARSQEEAEKLGYEAASKVGGGMKYSYEGIGEFEGKPCHIYIFAEVETLTVETEPVDPTGL
jgi:hypothetical protein